MDKTRFMLDTNVIIDTLNNDLDLLAFLETFPDCEIYINPVVAIEVRAKAGMSENEEAAARYEYRVAGSVHTDNRRYVTPLS